MKLNKKIKNTLLILIFCLISTTLLAGETDDAKSNLNKIQKQINLIDKEIKKNSKVKKGLNKSLKKHEKEISTTKKEIYKVKKKQKNNKQKLANLSKKLKKLEIEMLRRKQLQNEILYQSYIKPKPGYLQLFLEGINPNEVSRQVLACLGTSPDRLFRLKIAFSSLVSHDIRASQKE